MRWLNRLGAAVTVLAVVVVPPLAAVWWLQRHPWRPPTGEQVGAWVQEPLTAGTLVAGVVVLGALLWALIVVAAVRQTAGGIRRGWRRRRQRRFGRLRLPTATQVTAGSMSGVAALAMPAAVAVHPAPVAATGSVPALDSGDRTLQSTVDAVAGESAARAEAGIELPGGGWIPYRTAVAVTAVASLVWLHRRSRYQPTRPPLAGHDRDPDLRPLPLVVDAITAAVALEDPPPGGAAPAVSADALPAGVLVLSGPGAAAAARGLLITAILHAHTGSPNGRQVTLRRRDLERLIPGLDEGDTVPAGLNLTDSLDTAVAASTWDSTPGAGDLVLVVMPGPPGRDPPTSATVTVITDRPRHGGWHVAADGTTTGTTAGGRRLCVLDEHTATDLIGLIQQIGTPAAADDPAAPPAAAASGRARLILLGDCRLEVAGTPLRLHRVAALQILAYLAVHPEGATIADLIRAVWPGPRPGSITGRLHTTVSDLRQQLRPVVGGDPVLRREDRYLLNTAIIDTDLGLLRPVRTGTALTPADRRAACHRLIDGYHGELAGGHTWPWLQVPREALRRDVIDAYLFLADTATDARHAAQLLRAAVDIDPYNRHLHQRAHDAITGAADPGTDSLDQHFEAGVAGGLPPAPDPTTNP